MSWLILFMMHVASCGAAAVIRENSNKQGVSIIDASDTDFRRKLFSVPLLKNRVKCYEPSIDLLHKRLSDSRGRVNDRLPVGM